MRMAVTLSLNYVQDYGYRLTLKMVHFSGNYQTQSIVGQVTQPYLLKQLSKKRPKLIWSCFNNDNSVVKSTSVSAMNTVTSL